MRYCPGTCRHINRIGGLMDRHKKRSMQIKHNNLKLSKQEKSPSLPIMWVLRVQGHHMLRTMPEEHIWVCPSSPHSPINPAPLYNRDQKTLQCDPGHQLPKHTSCPSPLPVTRTPRISEGFGHTRRFLEPSGGAFYKSGPPWQSLPGIGPVDLGQL